MKDFMDNFLKGLKKINGVDFDENLGSTFKYFNPVK